MKYGFYEMQTMRDWYREVTADIGMQSDLVKYWIRTAALLITPIAPHFSEYVWSSVLNEPKSVQLAHWPTPAQPVNRAILESGAYMRGTVKTMRDSEAAMLKKLGKNKTAPFDPKKPKSVRIFVATTFPEWQDRCVRVVRDAYDAEKDKVDDQKVRELLTAQGLMKDKRAMPFVQAFKVRGSLPHLLSSSPPNHLCFTDADAVRNESGSLEQRPL
jgi:leucyl-tRNA synthetase